MYRIRSLTRGSYVYKLTEEFPFGCTFIADVDRAFTVATLEECEAIIDSLTRVVKNETYTYAYELV